MAALFTGREIVWSADSLKQRKRALIEQYAKADDSKAWVQVLETLIPIGALWWLVVLSAPVSYWLTAGLTLVLSLFMLRVVILMHDAGHNSLFMRPALNETFSFVFGVLLGMPQRVWSINHDHHHATNGNWEKHRGALNILTVEEYAALSELQKRRYRRSRSIWLAPVAGLLYFAINPRINWIKGNVAFIRFLAREKLARPRAPVRALAAEFQGRYWDSAEEYWHMTWNNLAVLAFWVGMCVAMEAALFFAVHMTSIAFAGGATLILLAIQHNFEHSYASEDHDWDYDTAAILGTSFLTMSRWLNWITADIGYHHVHHLSARIPNYRLAACHRENPDLFGAVHRLKVSEIPASTLFILWDRKARRIVSIDEMEKGGLAPA